MSDSHWSNLTEAQRYDHATRARDLKPNPAMISIVLDARGLEGPEVDLACGVEEPAVDLWEEGKLVPTPEQVRLLAKLTGVHPGLLYEQDVAMQGFICARSGPNRGCHRIDNPYGPVADVIQIARDTLW